MDRDDQELDPLEHESTSVNFARDWSVRDEEFIDGSNYRTMDGERYFTSLINEGASNSDWTAMGSQTDDQEQPIVDGNGSVRPNQKRSKNFSVEEDNLLISAWLNVSLDAIQGVDQSKSTYWSRIYEYYHSNKEFTSDHSQGSLMHHWSTIQEGVNKFAGCLSQLEKRNQSGVTIEDKLVQASKMWTSDDLLHRTFHFMHCCHLLKHQPKWNEKCIQIAGQKNQTKSRRDASIPETPTPIGNQTNNADDSEDAHPDPDATGMLRPLGRKEKEKAHLRSDQSRIGALDHLWAKKKQVDADKEMKREERYKTAISLEQQKIALEKEKFEFKRMIEEGRILRMDTSEMSIEEQEYYKNLKDEILSRRL